MKRIIGIAFVCFCTQLYSQSQIDMVKFDLTSVNVRNKIYEMKKISLNVASAGKVQVHLQGYANISSGDQILFQVGEDPVISGENSFFLKSQFGQSGKKLVSLSAVFNVEKGVHDFYAVASNIGVKNGNGIISFSGSLKAEFFSNDNDMAITNRKVDANNINMLDTTIELSTNFLNSKFGGTAILEMNGIVESSPQNKILLNITKASGSSNRVTSVQTTSENDNSRSFALRRVFYMGSGPDQFHLTSEVVTQAGNGVATIKGNFSMKFIGNFETPLIYSDQLPSATPRSGKLSFGRLKFTTKSPGKLFLSAIGSIGEAEWGKSLKVGISKSNQGFWQGFHTTIGPFYNNGYNDVPLPFAEDTLLEFESGKDHEYFVNVEDLDDEYLWPGNFLAVYLPDEATGIGKNNNRHPKAGLLDSKSISGQIFLKFNDSFLTPDHLSLLDVTGQLISRYKPNQNGEAFINMKGQNPGIYWLKFTVDGYTHHKKIVYR